MKQFPVVEEISSLKEQQLKEPIIMFSMNPLSFQMKIKSDKTLNCTIKVGTETKVTQTTKCIKQIISSLLC